MKKFEEEVKRPVIGIEQSSIKPSLGKAIEFYTGKVKEYHNAFNEMNKYIDGLESQLDYYKKDKRFEVMAEEILSLKSQLEKQQTEIPEVPQFVADWYEENKERLEIALWDYICDFEHQEKDEFHEFMKRITTKPLETIFSMKNGYTVKEKRFYLKHIDFCKRDKDYDWYMIKHSDGPLNHLRVEKETLPPTVDTYFTQQEIDSMAADSYEQIEVEE